MTSLPSILQEVHVTQGILNRLSLGQSLHFLTSMRFHTWTSALGARVISAVTEPVTPRRSSRAAHCTRSLSVGETPQHCAQLRPWTGDSTVGPAEPTSVALDGLILTAGPLAGVSGE